MYIYIIYANVQSYLFLFHLAQQQLQLLWQIGQQHLDAIVNGNSKKIRKIRKVDECSQTKLQLVNFLIPFTSQLQHRDSTKLETNLFAPITLANIFEKFHGTKMHIQILQRHSSCTHQAYSP